MKKRLLSLLLVLCMLMTCVPVVGAAATLEVDLTNGSITVSESNGTMTVVQGDSTSTGTKLFVTGGTIDAPTANTISVTGGNVALTIKDLYIQTTDNTSPIAVWDGSLTLTLGSITRNSLDASNSKGNDSKAGISVWSDASLVIEGGGYSHLTVNGGEWAAGIGGDMGMPGGNITINGGDIEANGGTYGAGIGGGYSGMTPGEDCVKGSGGNITINGGTIQAVSSAGAGIGGGRYGNGGTVTINGGTVHAVSALGAGIGGGQNGYGGYVKIGADVESVTAEGYYAAIGGGQAGNEYGCTDLIIKDFSKVETAVALETGTPFAERFYNNILHNGMTETNTGYGWEYGELRFLARSGKSGYISDETCTWLWQWSADGETGWTDIAYSDFFSISEKPDENKYYRCITTNEFGNSIISPVGQILPLEITSQPQDAVAEQGETAKFSVETNCNEAVVYWYWQQRFNGGEWTMIAGATTNTLTVTADEDGWEYRCMMEDDDGDCKYTETATLTLCLTPAEILLETPAGGNDHPEVTGNAYTFYEFGTAVPKNKEWQEIVFYAAGETTVSLDALPSEDTITALFWDDEDPVPIACEVSGNSITITCDEMPDEATGRANGYSSELYVTTSDGAVSLLSIRFISTASEDTAPAGTLCWRGIEQCGGNVYEPTGEYSTEPLTVHGTNTRRVVFYYGDEMLEPDELTFSEHSGLTVEEVKGENEDGEAFVHFRIYSENGVGFTDQTVSYNGQSITLNFEAVQTTIPDGLCYTIAGVSTDANGNEYYVDNEFRTSEISIPSVNDVNIRVYYDGELITDKGEIEWSDGLSVEIRNNDDGTFGCFNISFSDITDDTVQSFASEEDAADNIDVRPNIAPYGFYTEAEPVLKYVTQKLPLTFGQSETVYFYDATEGDSGTPVVEFEDAPMGITLTAGTALANGMVPYTIEVDSTAKTGKYTLMATGDVDWDFAELTVTVEEDIDVDPLADTVKNYGYHVKGTSKSGDLTYQWQKLTSGTWVDVEGETKPDLTVESSDSGTYRCALTNVYGNTVYTNDATRLSTTGAVVLDLANGPITVSSNGGLGQHDTGFVVTAIQSGEKYENSGPSGGKLIVVQSTETTTNTITSYDGRVPMIAINLCIETETGPAISVTGGQLDLTLNGVNEFSSSDSPAIRVARTSQSYPLDITGDDNAELHVSTGSETAAAIGSGENEYAGGVSLYNVKGSIRGGLHAIGSGDKSAEYGCYRLSISDCDDLELNAGKNKVVLQEMMQANTMTKLPQWGGEVLVTMSYPLSGCTWQWERSADGVTWEQLEGETASSHVIEPAYSGCYYRCVVTNTYGNELVVDLGQQYRFMITEQPSGVTVAAGSEATFTAKTNWESTHWQWQVSTDGGSTWSKIGEEQKSGAESVLTLTAEEAMNGNLYRCEIADAAGKYGYTEPAVLTVGVPTVPLSYTLDGIVLRDQSTNAVLSAIPSGSFLAELTVSNVSADTGATFVLVTYDADGMMLDMSYFIAHPAIGDSMTFGALVKNDGGAARIQAMALTSLGELIPLAESIEYPAVN